MRRLHTVLVCAAAAGGVFFVSGCERHGQHTDDDAHEHGRGGHDGRSHEEGAELVTYAAGRGLRFAPEVAEAMGLRTVSVVPGRIPRVISLVAEVVDATRAVAFVPLARAGDFSAGQIFEASVGGKDVAGARFTARLHSISRESQRAMGSVEVLFEVASEDVPRGELRAGGVIALTRLVPPAGEVPSIPREALLETAGGTFVYGVKEGSYYRIPVRAGAVGASDVAIVSGLSAGDVVVAEPVSQLWLAELRLTRGGGHSH